MRIWNECWQSKTSSIQRACAITAKSFRQPKPADIVVLDWSNLEDKMTKLNSKVAVVTGASRGIGRGIALALGEAGATVYVTGRSVKGKATTENLPGTIDETAEQVTARGGTGIAVRCDHTNDADIAALFERVEREQEKLDLLVNSAWG